MSHFILRDISKRFGRKQVFSHINWQCEAGEIWHVSGASGSGKTTLLRIIMGLERPSTGTRIGLDDKRFSAVFQENRLLANCTAIENVQFACNDSAENAQKHLESLLLPEDCIRPVQELSGGMQRRVAIVRAIAAPSDILILDEPFTGLDAENILRVSDYIHSHLHGRTVILSSHVDTSLFLHAKRLHLG